MMFQIRVTGILLENNGILLVKQRVTQERAWSLPGGRAEEGETLREALTREMAEETGLAVNVGKLLYICDKPDAQPPVLHITFLVERAGGELRTPSNEFDENPIADVRMVSVAELENYGFSARFRELVTSGFPQAGNYVGGKESIGL